MLRDRQLVPLAVKTEGVSTALSKGVWRRRVGAKALATLTRQLATLIATDIRLEEALRLIAVQALSPPVTASLLHLRSGILKGKSFASALSGQSVNFPEHFRASVAAGELSGRLGQVLTHLADFVESRYRANRKLQLALIYPALLASVLIGIMTLLMMYVVPDIVRVFTTRSADVPFITRG